MIVVALLISSLLLLLLGQWGGRDLIEDENGGLVNRFDVPDRYGNIPPSRRQIRTVEKQQRRAARQNKRLERTKKKIAQVPLGAQSVSSQ